MNLLKSKLSVAIAIGILGGTTQAFACSVTPDSILTEGQTLQLVADCTGGVDGALGTVRVKEINWQMAVGTGDPVSITGGVVLNQPKAKLIYLTTPIGLTSAGTGEYTFSVTGKYVGGNADGTDALITTTAEQSAKVVVKPASVAVALALGTNSVTALPAKCAVAVNGKVIASMPTSAQQCDSGKPALAISGPSYFTWSCLSQTGGAEDNCYATRTGYVAPTTTTPTTTTPTTTTPTTTTPTTTTPTTTTPTTTTSTSSSDTGIGTGLWVPPNMTNRSVADPSAASMSASYVPGCLNGQFASASSTGCAANSSYTGKLAGTNTEHTVTLGSGKQLVLRYKTGSSVADGKSIRARGYDGGNVGVKMRIWLSTSPTATYASVASTSPSCATTSTTLPTITTGSVASKTVTTTNGWFTSTSTVNYCKLNPNTVYYFGIEYDEAITTRFQIDESSADFL